LLPRGAQQHRANNSNMKLSFDIRYFRVRLSLRPLLCAAHRHTGAAAQTPAASTHGARASAGGAGGAACRLQLRTTFLACDPTVFKSSFRTSHGGLRDTAALARLRHSQLVASLQELVPLTTDPCQSLWTPQITCASFDSSVPPNYVAAPTLRLPVAARLMRPPQRQARPM
jgi:hypothetical protein